MRFISCVALLVVTGIAAPASAALDELPEESERQEIGIVPLIGGDSDFGIAIGTIASIAQFHLGSKPYAWRAEMSGIASFKYDQNGFSNPFQDYYATITLPSLLQNRLRLIFRGAYTQYTSLLYYGLGNASVAPPHWSTFPANSTGYTQAKEYATFELTYPHGTLEMQVQIAGPLKLRVIGDYFYERAHVYAGSKLDQDFASPDPDISGNMRGRGTFHLAVFNLGLLWDSRDNETSPSRGALHTLSVRGSPGSWIGTPHRFGGAYLAIRNYWPIWGRYIVLATRIAGDVLVGDVPFFMLAETEDGYALGGIKGVRGIPAQRYYGRAKAYGNIELRTQVGRFSMYDQDVLVGLVGFLDAGRVWADLKPKPSLDGPGSGIKYGVGGGVRAQFGQTFVLRIDAAWSKDATPIGLYFNVGQSF